MSVLVDVVNSVIFVKSNPNCVKLVRLGEVEYFGRCSKYSCFTMVVWVRMLGKGWSVSDCLRIGHICQFWMTWVVGVWFDAHVSENGTWMFIDSLF